MITLRFNGYTVNGDNSKDNIGQKNHPFITDDLDGFMALGKKASVVDGALMITKLF